MEEKFNTRYDETKQTVCEACNEVCVSGKPDPCLGVIPGVSNACCGHGKNEAAYIYLGGKPNQAIMSIEKSISWRGEDAVAFFELVKRGQHYEYQNEVEKPQ